MLERWRTNRPYILMFVLNLVVVIGVIYLLRRPEPRVIVVTTPVPRATPTVALIQVQVSGAVVQPGVYKLPTGAHLGEALDQAGGARPEADLSKVNLARKLNDGDEVRIPANTSAGNSPPGPAANVAGTPAAKLSGKININTATLEQLDSLKGIGPALAQRIIDYRNENGSFHTIDDLKQVKGIGDAVFNDIKDLITIE